jgi:hypothetical protein
VIVAISGCRPANGQPADGAGRVALDWDDLDWIEQRLSREHRAELERYRLEHDRNLCRHGHVPSDKLAFWCDELLFVPWRWGDDFPVSIARNDAVRLYYQLVEWKLAENRWNEWEAQEARAAARIGLSMNPVQPSLPLSEPELKPEPKPKPSSGKQPRGYGLQWDAYARTVLIKLGEISPGGPCTVTDVQAERFHEIARKHAAGGPGHGSLDYKQRELVNALRRVTGRSKP